MKIRLATAFLFTAIMLAGCGMESKFGISTEPFHQQTSTSGAQGVYQGTTSTGFTIFNIVLDNDTWWGIYGNQGTGGLSPTGVIQAAGSASNGSFTSSSLFNYTNAGATIATGSVSASYVGETSFSGTVTQTLSGATQVISFTGASPIGAGSYNYDQAASLGDIAGNWTMTQLTGVTYSVNFAQSGTFTATGNGCTITGTLTPRASGKNIFDVTLTVGASPCPFAGTSQTGAAFTYVSSGSTRQILLAATNSGNTAATVLSTMH